MKNQVTVEQRFEIAKQVAERLGKIPADKDAVQTAIESDAHPFWAEVEKHFGQKEEIGLGSVETQLASWKDFYQKYFRLDLAFFSSGANIPVHVEGFDRLIVVLEGLTMNVVVEKMRKHFRVSPYTEDLDKGVPTNDRDAKTSYALWVRERVEADGELKNFSANDLAEQGVKGVTLLERLLYEFKYFSETGKHLDIKNWTLCSGSRDSDGDVPGVRWDDDGLGVDWSHAGFRFSFLRARAVSL